MSIIPLLAKTTFDPERNDLLAAAFDTRGNYLGHQAVRLPQDRNLLQRANYWPSASLKWLNVEKGTPLRSSMVP